MTKEEMMALVRSVAVPQDVEHGMSHAYDLGVEWAVERAAKAVMFEVDQPQAGKAVAAIQRILNDNPTS